MIPNAKGAPLPRVPTTRSPSPRAAAATGVLHVLPKIVCAHSSTNGHPPPSLLNTMRSTPQAAVHLALFTILSPGYRPSPARGELSRASGAAEPSTACPLGPAGPRWRPSGRFPVFRSYRQRAVGSRGYPPPWSAAHATGGPGEAREWTLLGHREQASPRHGDRGQHGRLGFPAAPSVAGQLPRARRPSVAGAASSPGTGVGGGRRGVGDTAGALELQASRPARPEERPGTCSAWAAPRSAGRLDGLPAAGDARCPPMAPRPAGSRGCAGSGRRGSLGARGRGAGRRGVGGRALSPPTLPIHREALGRCPGALGLHRRCRALQAARGRAFCSKAAAAARPTCLAGPQPGCGWRTACLLGMPPA